MEKYKVSQELMDSIIDWKSDLYDLSMTVTALDLQPDNLYHEVFTWWRDGDTNIERNNRLIALIQYVSGEEVFEVYEPKWVVRDKNKNKYHSPNYLALANYYSDAVSDLNLATESWMVNSINLAFKFDVKEEAEQFANPLTEVIEYKEN